MSKRNWTILLSGYAPFSMVLLDGALTYEQALREARVIWPRCDVK